MGNVGLNMVVDYTVAIKMVSVVAFGTNFLWFGKKAPTCIDGVGGIWEPSIPSDWCGSLHLTGHISFISMF